MPDINLIFTIDSEESFNEMAMQIFRYQYDHNSVYRSWCRNTGKSPSDCNHYTQIPFLPLDFFRTHKVLCENQTAEKVFTSSGTTQTNPSRHYVSNLSVYEQSFEKGFRYFFGDPADYHILALLPGYLEREGSSLVYMVQKLIERSRSGQSGFYLREMEALRRKIISLQDRKILLIGVSFALWEMAEKYPVNNERLLVMETGGMKGKRKELIREELHKILSEGFGVNEIHSEYGMTELLSQAYSTGKGIFRTPPWMKILVRDAYDPLTLISEQKTGGINIIDLANIHSCSFIATQDLGKAFNGGAFEISGRFDHSETRGCNLMLA